MASKAEDMPIEIADGRAISVLRRHDPADRDAILKTLIAYNEGQIPRTPRDPLAILIEGPTGGVAGGLWGRFTYDWLFVELLAVPPELRGTGIGRRLMGLAEDAARREGCIGIWLDTYGFQAPGFYAKLGFTPFGVLPDHPLGSERVFLQKRLDRSEAGGSPAGQTDTFP